MFGGIGFSVGASLALVLVFHAGLSLIFMTVIDLTALATFFSAVAISTALTGTEAIVYYRNFIIVISISAGIVFVFHQPILSYLDITVIGVGTFLAFGRLGCLSVGCCHGHPFRWGVAYGQEHVRTGFPSWLAGVRLFPVQALESFWVFCIVMAGTIWQWRRPIPGSIFAFYIVAYGLGRFFLEFLRGDEGRRYLCGFSEAQWTSLILAGSIPLREGARCLPLHAIHFLPLIVLIATAVIVSMSGVRLRVASPGLFSAAHENEIARALTFLRNKRPENNEGHYGVRSGVIHVAHTSLGLSISRGKIRRFRSSLIHYSISSKEKRLSPGEIRSLARLLRNLLGVPVAPRITVGPGGCHFIWELHPRESESDQFWSVLRGLP
jgi:hypothetical protein